MRSPSAVVTGSLMLPVPAGDDDIDLLTLYTFSLRRRELPGSYLPKDRLSIEKFGEREFASDGTTIFGAFCTGCHGGKGQGRRAPGRITFPAIASPDFLALVSDEVLTNTVIQGRPGRKMPAWGEKDGGLRIAEIKAAIAFLRQLSGVGMRPDPKPARWISGNIIGGKRLYESACASCHGQNGIGGEGPALNNRVLLANATDTYFVETISRGRQGTTMEGFLNPSPARPTLSSEEIQEVIAYIRTWQGDKK
jgi:cytochrome c oxidase cbb3-type subunit 3